MMPRPASPMFFSASSEVNSPCPRTLVFLGSTPRSASALPRAAGGPNVDGVGVGVLGTLDEGGEVLVRHRITRRADDLAAGILESLVERGFAVMPGAEVGHHRIGFADAALVRPAA